ncbi:hypothetical protein [Rubinisphaera sp.]|uniref:hypothetical protein n=1 Tax=Rubinisphaera sp. TaxID=2024857 RepID=UPI0025E0F67A|nr:hypothetical protein [Rubinisphaera sp.]
MRRNDREFPFPEKLKYDLDIRLRFATDYLVEVNDEIGHWDYINGRATSSTFLWTMMGLRALLKHQQALDKK